MASYQLESKTGDTTVEMECDIEEDIESELEDFVRLSHTFQFVKAQQLYDECLSSHEAWFPVSAEYADFLCLQRQYDQLKSFSLAALSRFSDVQELALFQMMEYLAECYLQPRNINNTLIKALKTWKVATLSFPASSDIEVSSCVGQKHSSN